MYKTVRADGSVVYSDIDSKGAVPVDFLSMNTAVVPALSKTPRQTVSQEQHVKRVRPEVQYKVSIHSPAAEQTLRDNSGTVTIKVNILPNKSGKFQLILDDKLSRTQSNSQFQLESVNRGAHTIKVNFLDNSGKILASSKQQIFYLQKASALINAK